MLAHRSPLANPSRPAIAHAPGTQPPPPAPPQHLLALAQANRIRQGRARLLVELAALPVDERWERVAALIADTPANLTTCPVGKLLRALPRVGDRRAQRMLRDSGVGWPLNLERPIGRLSDRQRGLLAATLRAEAPRPPADVVEGA